MCLERTRRRIKVIEDNLKNCRFTLDPDMKAIDYSKEPIQASVDNSSSMEKSTMREESKLEKELDQEICIKFKYKRKIRNIQKQIDNIEIVLEQLPINYMEFLEYIYKDKLTHRKIAMLVNCDSSTVSRNRNNIVIELRKTL